MSIINRQKTIMLDIKYVASINWDKELGQRLKLLRGKLTIRALSDKTASLGERISYQYIHMLEEPERYENAASTVSFRKICTLLKALDSDVDEFFDAATIVSIAS